VRIRPLAAFTVIALAGGTAVCVQPAVAAPDTLYVNNATRANCSDAGSGTQDQPYCTLQTAAAAVQPGQTVEVTGGTYKGEVDITRSGTPDAPITFTAAKRGAAFVHGDPHAFTVSGAHDIVIRGFSMSSNAEDVVVTDSSRITIDQNRVSSVNIQGTGSRIPGIGIIGQSSDVTVSRNQMYGSAAEEVLVAPGVTGTVITTNQLSGYGGSAVLATDAPGTVVTSNSILGDCTPQIALAGVSTGSTLENNILVDGIGDDKLCASAPAAHAKISISSDSAPQTISDYNLIQPPGSGAAPYDWAGVSYADPESLLAATGQGGHDLVAQPDLSSDGSPAFDSADADAPGELPTDMYGYTSVDNPLVADTGAGSVTFRDRGASEFQDPYHISSVTVTPDQGPYPLPVTATAVEVNPWSTPVESYTFDFGDGSAPVVTTTPSAQHTYTARPANGSYYTVSVIATTATRTLVPRIGYVWVTEPAPLVPALKMTTPPSAIDRLTVEADTSASTDAWAITNRKIDFGDGSAPVDEGTATTDTHTYAKPGTYTVRLTETDWAGNTASTTTSMTVPTVRYSTALSLTTNASSYAYGATATVTAHLGTTYSNRAVSIYAQPYGGTKTLVKTGKVDSHGNLVASYKVTRNTVFTTAFSGDLEYAPATASRTAYGYARVPESQSGYYTSTYYGSTRYRVYHHTAKAQFNATVAPNKAGQCLIFRLQKYYSGAWHTQSTSSCHTLSSTSTGYLKLTLTSGAINGKYRMAAEYVHSTKDNTDLNTWSSWQYFTVRK